MAMCSSLDRYGRFGSACRLRIRTVSANMAVLGSFETVCTCLPHMASFRKDGKLYGFSSSSSSSFSSSSSSSSLLPLLFPLPPTSSSSTSSSSFSSSPSSSSSSSYPSSSSFSSSSSSYSSSSIALQSSADPHLDEPLPVNSVLRHFFIFNFAFINTCLYTVLPSASWSFP